jgi:death-on-curing family protein
MTSNMVWIPSIEYILFVFKEKITEPQLINRQGLISTLDKVRWGIPTQQKPLLWNQVTILFKDIVEQHFFMDGNKRISILIAYIFLINNGYEFSPKKGEIFSITMETAKGNMVFQDLKKRFMDNSKKA